ncbi:MAG: IS66 family transposase [Gammaproteobacteria bacterium]
MSLGTVFNKQRLVNAALEKPVNDVLAVVKSSHVNMDETSHNREGKRHWLWGMVSAQAAYFEVNPSRGKKVVKRLLAGFHHVLITDRYAAYNDLYSSQRQLCWAHLKRNFTRFSQRKDPVINRIGKELLTHESHLFTLWHAFKAGHIQLNRAALAL